MPNPECECPLAGYCQRHKINKSKRLHELCSSRHPDTNRYWAAWERGELGATRPHDSKIPKVEHPRPATRSVVKSSSVPSKPRQSGGRKLTDADWIERLDLQCCHRTAEPVGQGICTQCGSKGNPLPLYRCGYFDCDVSILHRNPTVKSCVHCDHVDSPGRMEMPDVPNDGPLTSTVFVTTALRGGHEYLTETLDSLHDAGYESVNVFAEPNVPRLEHASINYWTNAESRLWAWPNFQRGFTHSVQQQADYVLYVQDDVLLSKNARSVIEHMIRRMPPNAAIWSLYFAAETGSNESMPSDWDWWAVRSERAVRGACAMVFPRRWAERIAKDYVRARNRAGVEIRLWEFCKKYKTQFCYFGPRSLAQHIGAVSAIHAGMGLTPSRVAGSDWVQDASELGLTQLEAT